MKWNMVCSVVSFEIGGRTPRASHVSNMMFVGWFSDRHGILAFPMYSMGYALHGGQISKRQDIGFRLLLPTSVFRQSGIVVVHYTSVRVEYHVLEDRSEFDGMEDIRLLFCRQIDTFGVALNSPIRLYFPRQTSFGRLTPPSMLKIPRSLQQCSSSPMSARLGSAERVVFPVPDRPKKTVTSPSLPSLAEECRVKTLCLTGIS